MICTTRFSGVAAVAAIACSTAAPQSASAPAGVVPVDAAACTRAPAPAPQGAQAFRSLAAAIVDPGGDAVPDAPITVCGFDACLTGKVDAKGSATVTNATGTLLTRPAFKIGDGLTIAELAYPLGDRADFDFGTTVAIPLPDFAEGVPLAAGASATMAGVTLTIAPGAAVGFDPLLYAPDQRGLRVAPIPLDPPPLAIDPGQNIALAYALTPQGTTFCPAASLDLPNRPGWPAGTEVEILVHGIDLEQRWAPYAGWAVVSPGRVSGDAQRIVTAPGAGVPVLGAIGIRRK
jgi:hypothetical protein